MLINIISVKRYEYAGLTRTAREIRSHGCPVLLTGPFTGQIHDPGRWDPWVSELGGPQVRLLWVRTPPDVLHGRIVARGSARDTQKLARFDAFVAATRPDTPPAAPHIEIVNDGGPDRLAVQVARIGTG